MNARKLCLIVLIFGVATAGWQVLGGTIRDRTQGARRALGQDVDRMFGPRLTQRAPVVKTERDGRPPDRSDISVEFEHESRYRGLVWFSVYEARFDATYVVEPGGGPARFVMELPGQASIDALEARANGRELAIEEGAISAGLDGNEPVEIRVSYRTTGQESWIYDPGEGDLRNFRLAAVTNFAGIDYPSTGLSPTEKAAPNGKGGRTAVWDYSRMIPARNRTIGVLMPSMPPSGELSARIARFAPVSLFFFLCVMVTIQLLKGLRLHPMNYLLVAAGFFAFHILLAYLVDHLAIHLAFWVSAAVSVLLVVTYLRLVLGWKAAILVAGAAQLVYLVFFSYAFFWEGWTGLTVVIGAIVTLFLIMQLTGRIEWDRKFPDLAVRKARTAH